MSVETKDSLRYLITFAYLADEAVWCNLRDYDSLCAKVRDVWNITEPSFRYHITSTSTCKAVSVNICSSEEFRVWFADGKPLTRKLVAHDKSRGVSVPHSEDLYVVPRQPLIDPVTLSSLNVAFTLRNATLNELIFCHVSEEVCWGTAVLKAQRAWKVRRPLFRYLDDVEGERVVVSILDVTDFQMYSSHRMSLYPELNVFEHAPLELIKKEDQQREEEERQKEIDKRNQNSGTAEGSQPPQVLVRLKNEYAVVDNKEKKEGEESGAEKNRSSHQEELQQRLKEIGETEERKEEHRA